MSAKRTREHLACTAFFGAPHPYSPSGMQAPAGRRKRKCDLQLSLFVRWHSPAGKTKVTRLQLRSVGSVDCLQARRAPGCKGLIPVPVCYQAVVQYLCGHDLVPAWWLGAMNLD